jgi:hypothetical protein
MEFFKQLWKQSAALRIAAYVALAGLLLTIATAKPRDP